MDARRRELVDWLFPPRCCWPVVPLKYKWFISPLVTFECCMLCLTRVTKNPCVSFYILFKQQEMPLPCVPFWKKNIIWYIFIVAQKFFIFFSNSKAHVFLGKMFCLRGAALKKSAHVFAQQSAVCTFGLITTLHLSTHFQAPHWEVFTIKSANKRGVLCHF